MEEDHHVNQSTTSCCGGGDQQDVESRFADFCKNGLHMDEPTFIEATKLFDRTKHLLTSSTSTLATAMPEESERFWFAFVLYSLKRLSNRNPVDNDTGGTHESGFNVSQILRSANLRIGDFLKELPQFVIKVGPVLSDLYGADWESRLEVKELLANVVNLRDLSKYYKRAFWELFSRNDADIHKQPDAANVQSYLADCHRFGWLLFSSLRIHAFSRFKDLVTCTHGLVSILAVLIIHVPIRFRNFAANDPRFVRKGNKDVDLLASLSRMYETSENELRIMMEKTNNIIADVLKKRPSAASECHAENLHSIDTDGLIYFNDLLKGSSMFLDLNILEKEYNEAIHNKGELDERLFINEEDNLLLSSSLSGDAINVTEAKKKIDVIASPSKTITSSLSPFRSPSASKPDNLKVTTATPVTTAMTTAKWLRTIISPLPSKPSPELEVFLSSCDKDVTADAVCRSRVMLEAIFPNSSPRDRSATANLPCTNLMDNMWAEQRRLEALKLYYRVLQAICTAEAQILHNNNLTSLLTNERFHRCMLACSAEIVLASHKTVTMLFPAVLERTGITAFDMSKVIESFIRHEESLPRELRRHLNSLEERLLESMVWERGSSMYNSLIIARPALAAEINSLGFLADPMPSLDAIAMRNDLSCGGLPPIPSLHKREISSVQNGDVRSPKRVCTENRSMLVERNSVASPVKDRLLGLNNMKPKLPPPALQSAFASPARANPGGGGETCAETSMKVFFGKILKLAAVRINGMVERLQLSQEIREKVYCFFQQILSQRTTLFFNRHVDQIILCCIYGISKISQLKLTFREIIHNYKRQPHCKPQVFRSVFVNWSSARHNGKTGQDHVDIIVFYNEIFIPTVKQLLVEHASSGAAQKINDVSESIKNCEGPCPASPKVSPFPSLPDMSPKKVSAAHNVYVSPLRSTKMDALISNGSKSYYACVGESTHAYQSPSKDLTDINNRLNGTRKVRGVLNFDDVVGFVSDSMVANSLYLQNGTCPPSSGAQTKSEQSDA